AGELSERLAAMGARAVTEELPRYVAGECTLTEQDHAGATSARPLEKSDGRIDWSRSAPRVHDHVRGMSPWPGAHTTLKGRNVKVETARVIERAGSRGAPGTAVLVDKSRVVVACGEGAVELVMVKPEGKRAMAGAEWAQGRGIGEGDVLG